MVCRFNVKINNKSEMEKIILNQNKDTERLVCFLKKQNITGVYRYLRDANITYRSLPYLSKEDLLEIRHTGLRAEFREKLFKWRKRTLNSREETPSNKSKVVVWLQKTNLGQDDSDHQNNPDQSQDENNDVQDEIDLSQYDSDSQVNRANEQRRLCSFRYSNTSLLRNTVDIPNIVKQSIKGKVLLESYKETQLLTDKQRDNLISIILEVVFFTKTTLIVTHFDELIDQIIEVFPSEIDYKHYYYVPRTKNRNPRGRLYDKYKNTRAKLKKQEDEEREFRANVESVKSEIIENNNRASTKY